MAPASSPLTVFVAVAGIGTALAVVALILRRRYARMHSLDLPIFSVGLVADVQSAKRRDGALEGRVQRFSTAFKRLRAAIKYLNAVRPRLTALISLGDIVDGHGDEAEAAAEVEEARAIFSEALMPVHHVVGNHCLKRVPRQELLSRLHLRTAYYAVSLAPGWRLLVLDTTDLSIHGGWEKGSAEEAEGRAYMAAHAGEPRMQRWNGGLRQEQLSWLRAELHLAAAVDVKVIVVSHHALAAGSCRETHRSWNGDEVAAICADSPAFVAAFAGHDHVGGFAVHRSKPFVTLEALLEAPKGSNAFAVLHVFSNRLVVDNCGTKVTSRTLYLKSSRRASSTCTTTTH